jgi:outer membrane lipoprotein-sorting protein
VILKNTLVILDLIIVMFFSTKESFADTSYVVIMKDPNAFIKKCKEMSQSITSIEGNFKQVKHLSFIAENVNSRGKYYFKKDNLLRWEYLSPMKYIMVMNNDKYFVKDENKVSAFDIKSNKMIAEINDVILACIKGNILDNDSMFKVSFYESSSTYSVKLLPLSVNMREYLLRIELIFSKSDFTISELKMIENSGDYTNISFQNRKLNVEISDEVFNLK